jgi:DNA primase
VAANVTPDRYTVASVPGLLRSRSDPWAQYWDLHQSLSRTIEEAFKG